jgi:WD40 repeat protein
VTGHYLHPTWRLSPDGKQCVAIVAEKTAARPGLPNPYIKKDNEVNVPQNPAIQVWDTQAGKLIWERPFPSDHAFFHLSFMPDGKKVAVSSRNMAKNNQTELLLWDVGDGTSNTLIRKEPNGPRGEFSLTATGRYLQYDDPPWASNTPWPGGAEPQIVGGWWTVDKNEAKPAITFDDDGNWYDTAGMKHVLFTDAEKRQERKEGQRRTNLRSMHAQDTIAIPGALANLSPDDRWLAMRLTFLEPIIEPMRKGSNFRRDSWNHELHLIDLLDGSKSPVIYNAEHWLFSPDGKTLATTGDGDLRIWKLPLK